MASLSNYKFTNLLINGCSHSAGSEIFRSGLGDHEENRKRSFGSKLANRLGVSKTDLSVPGASNDYIARTTLFYILDNPRRAKNTLFLIHWTGEHRTEMFYDTPDDSGNDVYDYVDYTPDKQAGHVHHDHSSKLFPRKFNNNQKVLRKHLFYNSTHWYVQRYLNIIQTQANIQNIGAQFIFANAFQACKVGGRYQFYRNKIDRTRFKNFDKPEESFWEHCKSRGFDINGQKYWHHKEDAHQYWADKLFDDYFT